MVHSLRQDTQDDGPETEPEPGGGVVINPRSQKLPHWLNYPKEIRGMVSSEFDGRQIRTGRFHGTDG
jgi:hypothetical protein